MNLAIDIDGVVADYFSKFLEFYNKKTGKNLSVSDWKTYNFWDSLPVSKEEGKKLMEEFYLRADFDEIQLIEGAKEAIIELAKQNQIYVITARPLRWGEKTKKFFDKHFSGLPLHLVHSRDENDKTIYKREICRDLNINILIEDYGDIALQCAEIGVRVFLLDYLYNQNVKHENIIRVKNWDEILDKIKKLNDVEVEE